MDFFIFIYQGTDFSECVSVHAPLPHPRHLIWQIIHIIFFLKKNQAILSLLTHAAASASRSALATKRLIWQIILKKKKPTYSDFIQCIVHIGYYIVHIGR
jgi:hypothetical protein